MYSKIWKFTDIPFLIGARTKDAEKSLMESFAQLTNFTPKCSKKKRGQLFTASTALRLPELNALKTYLRPSPDFISVSLPQSSVIIMSATIDNRVYDELEALEAILIEDFAVKHEDGVPRVIETLVHPSTGDQIDQQYVCLTLEVKLTPNYPDTIPEVFLRNPRGLDDKLLNNIYSRIKDKLDRHVGNPIVFELIEMVREYLTQCNLPRGQCVICLHSFVKGDVFIKTPCYHHFHSHCMYKHLVNSKKYYMEELDKLPNWQRAQAQPYQQTCPVCRNAVVFDEKVLETAPAPVESLNAPPFRLTPEIKALQQRMSEVLARQVARGGVVGMGDDGPPLLTITTSADKEQDKGSTSGNQGVKAEASRAIPSTSAENPEDRQAYHGPYRGFNRRGKPGRGRRGRGAAR